MNLQFHKCKNVIFTNKVCAESDGAIGEIYYIIKLFIIIYIDLYDFNMRIYLAAV